MIVRYTEAKCAKKQKAGRKLVLDLLFAVTQPRVLAGALLQASHWHSGFCAPCFHCALPRYSCLVTGVLQGSPGWTQGFASIQPEQGDDWKKVADPEILAVLTALFQEAQPSQKQHDVCYRGWWLCVPTCTAAQLGLYVFARRQGRRFWCVQSRVGRHSSGHEHLQAQRSWSELQLSQQLLPSEEWGRIQVMLRWLTL